MDRNKLKAALKQANAHASEANEVNDLVRALCGELEERNDEVEELEAKVTELEELEAKVTELEERIAELEGEAA